MTILILFLFATLLEKSFENWKKVLDIYNPICYTIITKRKGGSQMNIYSLSASELDALMDELEAELPESEYPSDEEMEAMAAYYGEA